MTKDQRQFLIDYLRDRANYHYRMWEELRAEYHQLLQSYDLALVVELERLEKAIVDEWEAARVLQDEVDHLHLA